MNIKTNTPEILIWTTNDLETMTLKKFAKGLANSGRVKELKMRKLGKVRENEQKEKNSQRL